MFYANIITAILVAVNHNSTTPSLSQEAIVPREAVSHSDRHAALGATVQSATRVVIHRKTLLVLNANLTARRSILVSRILLLPQIDRVKTTDVADSTNARDEVRRGALSGLRGGGRGCGGV